MPVLRAPFIYRNITINVSLYSKKYSGFFNSLKKEVVSKSCRNISDDCLNTLIQPLIQANPA